MSDDNRQHYVFLQDGDVIQEGDEYFYGHKWMTQECVTGGVITEDEKPWRRPIQRSSQSDGQTIEQSDKLTVWDEYAIAYTNHLGRAGWPSQTAIDAKCYADAMMKARVGK